MPHRQLIEERDRVVEELERLGLAVDRASWDCPTDAADASAMANERELAAGRLEGLRHRLDEVVAALSRHDAGSYGRCERCGEGVSPDRLTVLPTARVCTSCLST